jgi:glutathione S-transferase
MITLWHAPLSRSCRVVWLLEELGLPYRIELLGFRDGTMQSPAYLVRSPLGKVPTLEDDDVVIFESGAIVEWLLEKYGKGRLAPRPGGTAERARFLQWLHWSEATLLPPLAEFAQHTLLRPESERIPALVPDARRRIDLTLRALDADLAGRTWLLDEFSAADVMTGYGVQLARILGVLPAELAHLVAYLERCAARPAFQKALSG